MSKLFTTQKEVDLRKNKFSSLVAILKSWPRSASLPPSSSYFSCFHAAYAAGDKLIWINGLMGS